jgi:hypothetical protein
MQDEICIDCGCIVSMTAEHDGVPTPVDGHTDGDDVVCDKCWEKRA